MHNKPKCVIVTGRPGSGKTTFARELGQRLSLPVISRDAIKEGYVNTFGVKHDRLPSDTNRVVSDFFFEVTKQYLTNNVSILIEAAFQHQIWEPRLPGILDLSAVFLVVCSVPAETAAARHLRRGLDDPNREFYHGDRRVSMYRETGMTPPPENYAIPKFDVPTIHVSTEDGYSPSLKEVAERVLQQTA